MASGTSSKARGVESSTSSVIPLDGLDVIAIEEVDADRWKRIFDVIGYPSGVDARRFSVEALTVSLAGGDASDELVEVLRALHELGTDDGLDAMKTVAQLHNIELGPITGYAPRDAAAELWLAQRTDAGLRGLFTRVRMQAEARRSPRSFREFRGARPLRAPAWETVHPRVEAAVRAWCSAEGFGDHVDVRGFTQGGDLQMQIVHGHRLQKPVVVKEGRRGRGTLELRPAHCDVIRYDCRGSWLRLSPRSSSAAIVEAYRRLLGEALFEDPAFFADADYSLRALQERGQEALDATLLQARVTDLVWDRSGDIVRIKSADCLAAAKAMQLPVGEGDFIEARISVVLPGRTQSRRLIHIKVPNKVDYPRDEAQGAAIDRFLDASGIRVAARERDRRDLWDLHPWTHGEATWREAYPDDVDALVNGRTLVPIELSRVAHPDHAGQGRVLEVVDDLGISTDEDVPPRLITPTDVSALALDPARLTAAWRDAAGLEGDVRNLGHGAYLLGERSFDSVRCAVAALIRGPTIDAATLGQQVRAHTTPGARLAILVPHERSSGTGLVDVMTDRLLLDARGFWRKFFLAASVGTDVPALWYAPPDAHLVVDRRRGGIWLHGVPVDVGLESGPYQLLAKLAEARGGVVASETLAASLSPGRAAHDESFVRKVKRSAKAAVDKAIADGRLALDGNTVIVSVHGRGYRLGVPSYIA